MNQDIVLFVGIIAVLVILRQLGDLIGHAYVLMRFPCHPGEQPGRKRVISIHLKLEDNEVMKIGEKLQQELENSIVAIEKILESVKEVNSLCL